MIQPAARQRRARKRRVGCLLRIQGQRKVMIKIRFKLKWLSASFAFLFSSFALLCLYGAGPGDVTAKVVSSGLVITNNSPEDVYYAVHEESILALIKWAPFCTDENRILPKTSVHIPANFEPSGKVHVFWWHKGKHLMDSIHFGPDEVRSFVTEKR